AAGLSLAPCVLANVAVPLFAGWEGLKAPYAFHSARGMNQESTYDALVYLTHVESLRGMIDGWPWMARSLQIATALAAVALRPRTFEDVVNAFLFALLGFITFSVFHSPQYLLWVVPVASLASSRTVVALAIAYSWVTFLYFPVIYDLRIQRLLEAIVLLIV